MTETILRLVEDWGIWGVLLSLFIEGSAFPFIGTFFIVTVGFILDLSWFEIGGISILGSFLYAVGSYIPYFIGYKLGNSLENRLSPSKRAGLEKAKANFSKYGIWSIVISSPLHLGNVIPFLAGVSNMNLRLYTLLTMIGIAPTTFLFLSIGHFYNGDTETAIKTIKDYQSLLFTGFVIITVGYIGWRTRGHRQKKKDAKEEMIG
ncbi:MULTISPECIES: DedA family protein [Priestia]|uniref:DedA family protein n=1 Tax=Priestia TaxID=2800373 RepID=UPI001ADC6B64|nr:MULTISPECIES: VTT domain-containing protein [Priestia]QTL52896.1 VTT domain-containing protein [Priestia aryabhattai]USL45620.1 VTT domain-containing protein [Priestia megaterium]